MSQKDYFNAMASTWDERNRHDLIKVELMVGLLDIRRGDTVLDVGTGTGVLLPVLSNFTDEENITAIDVAENMISVAKEKFKDSRVTFVADDVLTHPFPPDIFDFIVCYNMFPHFQDKKAAVTGMIRLLKKGGKLAILHSLSRERINGVHRRKEGVIKEDNLPTADVVMDYMNHLGLREEILIDNDDMYLVCGRKL